MSELKASIIEKRMEAIDGKKGFYLIPEVITITADFQKINCESNIFFLDTPDLDIPVTASLELISADNYLSSSNADYKKIGIGSFLAFTDSIDVITHNYGTVFKPFKLTFIKAVPFFDYDK